MKHPIFTDSALAAMLVEYGQERFFKERMWERASGKTTAAILKALLTATENPRKWVLVDSQGDYSGHLRREHLYNTTAELARPLEYTQVYMGHMRARPAEEVLGNWPQHILGENFVWVRFGSGK